VVLTLVFQFMWNFSLSFQLGALSVADGSGRLVVLAPAAQGLGGTLGPALAGTLAKGNDYWTVSALGAVASIAGLVLIVSLCRAAAGAGKAPATALAPGKAVSQSRSG
jgi:hypothetical protein